MLEVSTTWAGVKVGDVMFKGTVVRIGAARKSRSGRELMSLTYDSGETAYNDPETVTNVKRPE